ncbi:MAG TPA: tetratricopeptide repeat protein, partial [Bacteroidota bacterium]
MKRLFAVYAMVSILAVVVFQGFQCASAEFTGAKVHIQQRNYAEALPLLEKEVQMNPQNEEAWYLLGAVRADMNDYKGMNEAFDAALKISNVHVNEITGLRFSKWGIHINAGVNYLERASADSAQLYDQAVEEFQKAIVAWPDTSLTYRYLGYSYNNKGDTEHAIEAFKKAWAMGDEAESAKRAGIIYIRRGEELKNKFDSENAEKIKSVRDLERVRRNTLKSDVTTMLGAPDDVKRGPRGTKKEDWTYKRFNLVLAI